jgi:recombination protein RecT
VSEQQLTIVEAINGTEERFHAIAPAAIRFEAEKGFAVQLLKNNEYLMSVAQNHPQSLQQALTNVAAIGLSLNPAEKQAYLITRTVSVNVNGQKKYQTRIFLEPSYMGLIKLATDSGSIKWVQALPVYSNDEFTFMGVGVKPEHKFNPFAKPDDRGEFIGVYCVAKTSDGDFLPTMMSAEQVHSIRDRSESWKAYKAGKAKSGGPWESDFIEQAKKTVIRNAFKTWPRSDLNRMAHAVDLSNINEGFEPICITALKKAKRASISVLSMSLYKKALVLSPTFVRPLQMR